MELTRAHVRCHLQGTWFWRVGRATAGMAPSGTNRRFGVRTSEHRSISRPQRGNANQSKLCCPSLVISKHFDDLIYIIEGQDSYETILNPYIFRGYSCCHWSCLDTHRTRTYCGGANIKHESPFAPTLLTDPSARRRHLGYQSMNTDSR